MDTRISSRSAAGSGFVSGFAAALRYWHLKRGFSQLRLNLLMHNEPVARMMRFFLGMPADAPIPGEGAVNVLKLTLDPNGLRRWIVNWEDVCTDLLHWIRREAMGDGPGSEAAALLDELTALPGLAERTARQGVESR